MESATTRTQTEKQKKELLLKQIAILQGELSKFPDAPPQEAPSSPKRKSPEPTLLAPPTPSPKKKRKVDPAPHAPSTSYHRKAVVSKPVLQVTPQVPQPGPSTFLNRLKNISTKEESEVAVVTRSSAFAERAEPPKRDDDLALIEDFEVGPYNHKAPFDDPHFESLEPHSGIRLSSRIIPYEDFQDYLRGRVYISPSRLYSCVRLLPDRQAYDVPVPGDWVTVAVVAERGTIKFSKAPVGVNDEEGDSAGKGKRAKEPPPKPKGKRYVNLKLVDFGARSRPNAGSTTAAIRGDAFLSLLLFEADKFDLVSREEGDGALTGKMEKVYRGGSGGAFEALSKVKEGDVVALLNPRILKPFQRSEDTPHPVNNILAVTPSSAGTILVLGRSKDLGMCMVVKRDGKVCGSWCDKRVSDACEFHVQTAVERRRASRPEFSAGTSGMSVSAVSKRKPAYDPARQWGLAPVASSSSSVTTFSAPTYVVSGHVVSSNSDNIGREGQAKAQRKLLAHEADQTLKKLLRNDKEGMKAVLVARKAGLEVRKRATSDIKGAQCKRNGKRKAKEIAPKSGEDDSGSDEEMEEDVETNHIAKKPAYSAEVIKKLGFDPLAKFTRQKQSETVNTKLEALASLQNNRQSKSIELGPRPGPKHRSSVKVPKGQPTNSPSAPDLVKSDANATKPAESGMIDLDDF
ncbi:hypothetical protein PC9H_011500 [Pleurotus ostreatus]|uniref:Zinc finger Mcm10/DnaG-type domain-containing protein n=1 Tax=Pleurotus ostreatus TaxID=5322 RepID=A0A8H6ZQP6_PLEOS|nr:uncharacterized protein PC9H_011500 [Pleurotus ostreatus]KAF7420981.1 hypothetical protein PC9H_011500 [Pleurotus ostreatus]